MIHYPAALVQAAVGGAGLLVLGVAVGGTDGPVRLDTLIAGTVSRNPPWPATALAVDWLGEPVGAALLAVLVAGIMLLAARPRYAAVVVLVQPLILVVADGLKLVVGRTIHGGSLSFPSGHTAGAVAFALMLALFLADVGGLRTVGRVVVVVGAAVVVGSVAGWAQIVVGAHYPTDTVGGLLLAVALVPLTALVVDRVADRRGRSPSPSRDDAGLR
ncbi:hypothetical protein GCM10023175_59630 [Pseudonocardia xishanensis]|uniref:Phosphatidic acid phosphatase type 2/haloperoxidase domain-containing protein n=1 Tax=Pseudonocardia xishanensis TaxID=630995 RepID=A0ABP8S2E4_9PSEU